MNRTIRCIREVNDQAGNFYEDAVALGDHAAKALGKARRAQMTSLENIAESALKRTDVYDLSKNRSRAMMSGGNHIKMRKRDLASA